jgi:FkbM family methyltransferase
VPRRRFWHPLIPRALGLAVRRRVLAKRVLDGVGGESDLKLLPDVVSPGHICWDIGANAGHYAVALCRLARHVYAFEPVTHNRDILQAVARAAALDNLTVSSFALADRTGHGSMRIPDEGLYGGYYLAALDDAGQEPVQTTSVDSLIAAGWPEPDFIKCDVEGAESRVIAGAADLIARRRPTWLLETFEDHVFTTMVDLGYRAFWYDWTIGAMREAATRNPRTRNFFFVAAGVTPRWTVAA